MPVDCPECKRNARAALRLMRAVLGMGGAMPATVAARREACMACPHFVDSRLGWLLDRCDLCNCLVHQKVKVAEERCPDDPPRWEAEKI